MNILKTFILHNNTRKSEFSISVLPSVVCLDDYTVTGNHLSKDSYKEYYHKSFSQFKSKFELVVHKWSWQCTVQIQQPSHCNFCEYKNIPIQKVNEYLHVRIQELRWSAEKEADSGNPVSAPDVGNVKIRVRKW